MNRSKKYGVILKVLLIGLWVLSGCSKNHQNDMSGSGILEAREVQVSSKAAGQVTQIAVREGDTVNEGQLIARLDMEKAEIQRKQALAGLQELRLNLTNARRAVSLAKDALDNVDKKHERFSALLAEGSVTQQQFDDLDTALKAAQTQYENAKTTLLSLNAKEEQVLAQIELLDSQIRDGDIIAPVSGTVIERYVERGEVTRPGGPIVSIADLQNMWLKIYLKEESLGKIHLGSSATVTTASATLAGRVTWISPKAEFTPKNVQTKEARADLVYAVKIEIENRKGLLKIGMPVDVVIESL